jgi:predicted NAD/FAD-binding protein
LNRNRLKIAVAGSGISGLSAAWLLGRSHDVTLFEETDRVGGHSNTVNMDLDGGRIPVDTGFIVFNRATYPNFTALLGHFGVTTEKSDMSFAVSLDDGQFEYSGGTLRGLLAQGGNLFSPRFWSMLLDVAKFYRIALPDMSKPELENLSLGEYLERGRFGAAFRDDHLLPMAGAIWSSIPTNMLNYPAASLILFHHNHGLMQLRGRPVWETVAGGSTNYIQKLIADFPGSVFTSRAIARILRSIDGVTITDVNGHSECFDHVVIAAHADQALRMLGDASNDERNLLGAFRYQKNLAVLHCDARFMPRRRGAWSSWNYVGHRDAPDKASFTYWMNRLQKLGTDTQIFVTLNPASTPESLHYSIEYEHPVFDAAAVAAQRELWSLQGSNRTWFCGAHFGYGFHEDGLQAGLAVAEALGGVKRPWQIPDESGRIFMTSKLPLWETLREAA